MVYLSKAYNEHKDFSILKKYLILGIIQFFIVWVTSSILWTAFEGSIIFTLFVIVNCTILFKSRNQLSLALTKWKVYADLYEGISVSLKREKIVKRSNRWSYAMALSLTIYILSEVMNDAGGWILMIPPNPCLTETLFGLKVPEPSNITLTVSLNLSSLLFVIANLGTLQFDLFLILSNLIYFLPDNCYITTAYQDRIIRSNVRILIEEQQPLYT